MSAESKGPAAVYVSWTTLNNALDQLAQGLPNRVDRSVFPGLSGSVQNQLLAALKFLGLIGDDLTPTAAMAAVAVSDPDARKAKLKAIIQDRYQDLFKLDLMKATPAQLSERMAQSYNVSGETREKAVRFFLAAAALELPISPRLQTTKAAGNGATVRRRRTAQRRPPTPPPADDPPTPSSSETAKVVRLRSGDTLTLSTTAGLFSLSQEDRVFVFGLIEQMEKYESADTLPNADEGDEEGQQ